MHFGSERKKNRGSFAPSTATKLTREQAKQFVARHASCNDQETMELLESLGREQQGKEKVTEISHAQDWSEQVPLLRQRWTAIHFLTEDVA